MRRQTSSTFTKFGPGCRSRGHPRRTSPGWPEFRLSFYEYCKLFPYSILSVVMLGVYFHFPVFLGHLVVAVSRSSPAKVLHDEKSSRESVEYMTRIIFLGGNPNRQQDTSKSCRRAPCPSEHANMVQIYMLNDQIFRMKKFARKCSIYNEN